MNTLQLNRCEFLENLGNSKVRGCSYMCIFIRGWTLSPSALHVADWPQPHPGLQRMSASWSDFWREVYAHTVIFVQMYAHTLSSLYRCMHTLCHLCTDVSKYLCVFCTPDNSKSQMQKHQNTDLSWRRSSLVLSAISRTTCCSDKLSFSASCTMKTAISLWVFVIVMLSTQNSTVHYVLTYSGNLL